MFRYLSLGIRLAFGGLTLAGGLVAGYASHFEPQWAEVVRVALSLSRLPPALDGLTIAQISDIHAGRWANVDRVRRFVTMANQLPPDIIAVTGDMVENGPQAAYMCARQLAALRAPLGVYAVMGDHERRLSVEHGEEPFRRAGLTVLCNTARRIGVNGASLWMVGVDDLIRGHGDLALALRGVPDRACKVLLAHEPDFADLAARYPIDLQLSGHTHGGQVWLPGIGPLILPDMGRRSPAGLHRVRDMWVYTNRGLGMARPTVRLNCRPEITLFTLHSAMGERASTACRRSAARAVDT